MNAFQPHKIVIYDIESDSPLFMNTDTIIWQITDEQYEEISKAGDFFDPDSISPDRMGDIDAAMNIVNEIFDEAYNFLHWVLNLKGYNPSHARFGAYYLD